jgi:tetratricopeptide (TPR) repeat protein
MYLGMGQMDEAEKEFVAALKLDQNFVPTVVNYADFLRQQGRDKEAIALLDQLLERVPDAASAWYALGLGLIRNKEYGPAAAALNKAVDLAPGEPTYVLALALVLDHQQNVTQAILTLDRGLQESPWAAELHQTRVQLLTRPGDNPRLRSAVEVWLGRLPTDPGAQAAAGRFLGAGPGAPR